jgi:hypothetical protein
MLKYKLNIKNEKNKVVDVKYESLYFSLDGTTITGVTDPSYGLSNLNTITVVTNESLTCAVSARDVMRCGYLIYNKNFNIEDYGETVGILYTDGQYYCVNKTFSLKERPQDGEYVNPFITVNEHEYEIGEWVENGNDPEKYMYTKKYDTTVVYVTPYGDYVLEEKNGGFNLNQTFDGMVFSGKSIKMTFPDFDGEDDKYYVVTYSENNPLYQ